MKRYEDENRNSWEEIEEYSQEKVAQAIGNLEALIETLSQTAISVKCQSQTGQIAAESLEQIISKAKNRLAQLRSVVDLKKELKVSYQELDSLELGEHLLIQLLLREFGHTYETQIIAYIQAEPNQRHGLLVEMLGLSTYSLEKIVERKAKERERQSALDERYKRANPF